MAYYIDDENINLDDLRKRIEETDLVPSRTPILDCIEANFEILSQQGIKTLANLRSGLKNPKRLATLSEATGIDSTYLTLLRREIEIHPAKDRQDLKKMEPLLPSILSGMFIRGCLDDLDVKINV